MLVLNGFVSIQIDIVVVALREGYSAYSQLLEAYSSALSDRRHWSSKPKKNFPNGFFAGDKQYLADPIAVSSRNERKTDGSS